MAGLLLGILSQKESLYHLNLVIWIYSPTSIDRTSVLF